MTDRGESSAARHWDQLLVPQTNVQLYRLLTDLGYEPDSLDLVRRVYEFSSRVYSGRYQGCGKPFVAHGLGTAGILAHVGALPELVGAALIHNVYTNGDLGGMRPKERARARRVVQKAVESLPPGVEQIRVRGDSALYEHALLDWLAGRGIGFAVSADMSRQLRAAIEALPEEAWQQDAVDAQAVRQWAEVAFVSDEQRSREPHRYLAIRILKKQGSLFPDGTDRRHFCIVTNRPGDGLELIRWHRGKAGTIEHTHDVLTNELAAEALPSQKFGANAAWVRLNVIAYNLLSALKSVLPEEFHTARPKRLRFVLFNTVGRVIRHARETLLRLAVLPVRTLFDTARVQIHALSPPLAGV